MYSLWSVYFMNREGRFFTHRHIPLGCYISISNSKSTAYVPSGFSVLLSTYKMILPFVIHRYPLGTDSDGILVMKGHGHVMSLLLLHKLLSLPYLVYRVHIHRTVSGTNL
jgi:hypothetical protein